MSEPLHVPVRAGLLVLAGAALLALAGCAAPASGGDAAGGSDAPAVDAPAAPAEAERPEGLDDSLPVPSGVLISATPEASAWEYIYGEVTTEEARAFADGFEAAGYDLKVTVDSDGVEQWYFQNADWAVKLEETHATEQLLYWVDPIIE
ncbi:hypothetical protein [Pseudolysinimonas sp.]|jgi:hypothetical protein|uniref:hypothetical protein n=1 Tax=Pseudolysinimonas sp. TaxID=2680009 RepID=UPI003784A44A